MALPNGKAQHKDFELWVRTLPPARKKSVLASLLARHSATGRSAKLAPMEASYSPVPLDTVATARDFQDRVARLAGAVFVIAAVMGAASVTTHLTAQTHASEI